MRTQNIGFLISNPPARTNRNNVWFFYEFISSAIELWRNYHYTDSNRKMHWNIWATLLGNMLIILHREHQERRGFAKLSRISGGNDHKQVLRNNPAERAKSQPAGRSGRNFLAVFKVWEAKTSLSISVRDKNAWCSCSHTIFLALLRTLLIPVVHLAQHARN
jgi:hypothetical protein